MKNIIIYVLPLFLFVVNSWGLYYLQEVEDDKNKKKILFFDIVVGFCSCFLVFWLVFTSYYINHPKVEVQYVEVPIEEEVVEEEKVYNTTLPEGMYYLGVEIIEKCDYLDGKYQYSFGVVDDPEYAGHIFIYVTESDLLINVPYILTMDSMGTDEILDDQIVVVWACVE